MNKISIILPVYNVEKYLDKCLDSLVNQTYKKLEIILVDDGSPDNSGKICDEWAKKDKRIKVIHKENGGVSSARNKGLDIATGDYIGFVDPDDYVDLTMYEKLVAKAQEEDADITFCGFKQVNEDTGDELIVNEVNLNKIYETNRCNLFLLFGSNIQGNIRYTNKLNPMVWRALFKKTFIGISRFRKFAIGEDLLFYLDIINKKTKFAFINEHLYSYLIRKSSVMQDFNIQKAKQRNDMQRFINEHYHDKIDQDVLSAHNFHFYSSTIKTFLDTNRKSELKDFFKDEFFLNLNTKNNYKCAMKQIKGFKFKISYFLCRRRMFGVFSVLLKLFK